jgi:hypothetical protein
MEKKYFLLLLPKITLPKNLCVIKVANINDDYTLIQAKSYLYILFILVGGYDGIYCGVWIKSARS